MDSGHSGSDPVAIVSAAIAGLSLLVASGALWFARRADMRAERGQPSVQYLGSSVDGFSGATSLSSSRSSSASRTSARRARGTSHCTSETRQELSFPSGPRALTSPEANPMMSQCWSWTRNATRTRSRCGWNGSTGSARSGRSRRTRKIQARWSPSPSRTVSPRLGVVERLGPLGAAASHRTSRRLTPAAS